MPDVAALGLPPVTGEHAGAADLSARAARIAVAVAAVLDERCTPGSGADEAAGFLRGWAVDASTTAAGSVRSDAGAAGGAPLDRLVRVLGLTDLEHDLVLLAGLPDEHEGLAGTFRQLNPHGEPHPTAGLAALVLGDRPTVRRLLTDGAAVRHGLLRLGPGVPFFERSLLLADAIWAALQGADAWPLLPVRVDVGEPPHGLTRWLATGQVRRAVAALRSGDPRTLLLSCPDETVALGRCAALAAEAGTIAVAARLPADDRAGLGLLALHAAARGGVPVAVLTSDGLLADGLLPGPLVVCTPQGPLRTAAGRAMQTVPTGPVGVADHRDAWRAAVPHLPDQAPVLAARHPVDPAVTAQVAIDLRSHQRLSGDVPDVSSIVRTRAAVALPAGVELRTPAVPWERLVLPPDVAVQLREAVARLRHQAQVLDDWGFREHARASRGARLLFAGPPGTGKTLAAEAVATAAGTDLLTVDVSAVVSKWVGETEKNLSAAFDAAERTQAVLLLDEADALFGSRTEISDAHDRYANLETAYLLQRVDTFDGLVVLATNLRHNIDQAFVRRMDFVVEFPLPAEPERAALWELHLPTDVRADDVDTTMLARLYPVPGGWIRNASVAAAFLAASDGDCVRQEHLVASVRREYAKAAMPFPGEPPRRRDDDV